MKCLRKSNKSNKFAKTDDLFFQKSKKQDNNLMRNNSLTKKS